MLLARDKQAELGRARRRQYPVHFYGGRNGAGKSLCAVYDTLPSLDEGRPVLSTVRLVDYLNPRACDDDACTYVLHGLGAEELARQGVGEHLAAHPCYVPFTSWRQMLDFDHGDILMDEITGVADSNDHYSMPSAVRNLLAQLRRRDVALRITGLNWIRADKRVREACNAVTRCMSYLPVRSTDEDGNARLWRPRRLIKATTYDAQSLPVDDHTAGMYEKADTLTKSRLWVPDCIARLAYDTFAPVLAVGTVTDSGRCAYCGGNRRAPECDCPDYVDGREERKERARRPRSGEDAIHAPSARHAAGQDTASLRVMP